MPLLTREDLFGLERYAEVRARFRAEVMAHKVDRRVAVGPHVVLCFEDRLTIRYQVQEMLRAERIFEPQGIQDELDAYNPLIPDGRNWKATCMLEFPDPRQRDAALVRLRGIEDRVWARVAGCDPVWAIADEDLPRADAARTSAVHFMRFELTAPMVTAVRAGAGIALGIHHPEYWAEVDLTVAQRDALAADLV